MTFYRILIPSLFSEWNRCLYLDSDLIINGDISSLYSTEMNDKWIAGVIDHYMKVQVDKEMLFSNGQTAKAYYEERHVDPSRYINGGVLLFNLGVIREQGMQIFNQMLDMSSQYFEYEDQDIFNVTLANKIYILDDKWNYMNNLLPGYKRPEDPIIFHHKPWVGEDIPQISVLYWSYLRETPYYFKVRAEFILHAISVSLKNASGRCSRFAAFCKLGKEIVPIFYYLAWKRRRRK